jgi:hypothetical protein
VAAAASGLQLFAPLCEDLLTVLDGERPEDSIALATAGGVRRSRRRRAPAHPSELEFVVDRRPAALADFRVDQVDGEFMWASAGSNGRAAALRVRKRVLLMRLIGTKPEKCSGSWVLN